MGFHPCRNLADHARSEFVALAAALAAALISSMDFPPPASRRPVAAPGRIPIRPPSKSVFVFCAAVCLMISARAEKTDTVTMEGVVMPVVTMDIKYGLDQFYKGFVDYVMPAGTFFSGPVYDSDGKAIREGDILASIDKGYTKLQHQVNISRLEATKADLQDKEAQYQSNLKIARGNPQAISRNALIASESEYQKAKAEYEEDQLNVAMTQTILDEICTLRARFDGRVNQVLFSSGWSEGLPSILNVSQMNPIFISIPLSRLDLAKFNYNTPVTVYPSRKGARPVGFFQGSSVFRENSMLLLVPNTMLPPPVDLSPVNGKKIPIVKTWCPVMPRGGAGDHLLSEQTMVVSADALFEETGKYHVWLVEGTKTGQPGQGMNYLNKVRKVPVKSDGKVLGIPSSVRKVTFTPESGATADYAGAILLSNRDFPEGIESGDTVCLYAGMYAFMPGEKVRVEVGPAPEKAN